MNPTLSKTKEKLKIALKEYPILKTTLYIGMGVLSVVIIGKVFKVLAISVREFKDFKSALNGK